MRLDFILCCFLLPMGCWSQINEDFSDGDFTAGHRWSGDSNSFIIEDEQLKLNGNSGGGAYLSTRSSAGENATWMFEVKMAFNPSSRNFCRIYLISDLPELNNDLKGYYVQIGNSQDQIGLYRQDISEHLGLIESVYGLVDTTLLRITIKVHRNSDNVWSLLYKYAGEEFELIGSKEDSKHFRANYFGLLCQYTVSRSKGFSFDNVLVEGKSFVDKMPPQLAALQVSGPKRLTLVLNEPIQSPDKSHFSVASVGAPSRLTKTAYNTFELSFQKPFQSGIAYTLIGHNIQDLAGNSAPISQRFTYWEPQSAEQHDIIITEIMADPTPVLQLPDKEYLELYNKSKKSINLKHWRLSDASRQVTLPEYLITPNSYAVICQQSASHLQPDSLNLIEINSLPALNNDGDLIVLADSTGKIIHFLDYKDQWYRSNLKSHGGWSLEMIDTNYPCTGAANWAASNSASGGTPGRSNSVATDNPDLSPPTIVSTFAPNQMELRITFDQVLSLENYTQQEILIFPPVKIDSFFITSFNNPVVTILLLDSLAKGVIYHISTSGFVDCNQNVSLQPGPRVPVGLAEFPDSLDLVINEVLFNPRPLGVRFVELYNRSSKALNLKNWRFAKRESLVLTGFNGLSSDNLMIYPGEYLVFTSSSEKLRNQYPAYAGTTMIQVDALPSMDDNNGSLVVLDPLGSIIDELCYDQDMHHSLLTDQNGVSLERASPDLPSSDPNNWYSASESSGYATPGKANSQTITQSFLPGLTVVPEIISANSRKYPSYASILYQIEQPGSSGSVTIYNTQGYKVRTLANNSLLSARGSFKWDGTDDDAKLVPFGYYIVVFQIIESYGQASQIRQTLVVAPNF